MKNKIRFVFILLFALFLVGCGSEEQTKKDDDKKVETEKVVKYNEVSELEVGDTFKLNAYVENGKDEKVVYASTEASVLSVTDTGELTALKEGNATINIIVDGEIKATIEVKVNMAKFEIHFNGNYEYNYSSTNTYALEYTPTDENNPIVKNGLLFSSSKEKVATIDEEGKITTVSSGKSTITVTSKDFPEYKYTVEIEVKLSAIDVVADMNIENPLYQSVNTYGSDVKSQMVMGSVNLYSTMDLNLIERIVSITNNSPYAGQTATEELLTNVEKQNKYMRSGILHTETSKITYHDTGNNSPGANAEMHASYLVGSANLSSRARSWHYTVDDQCAIHHIPDNEVTWQGDNYLAYSTSIGIETCVNYGSDLELTWHRTAKLMAKLLVKHNMSVDDIVQHYYWSGKNCPQTLRMNDLYSYAIDMVKAEYTAITLLSNYTITFKSLAPEYINDNGKIIALPETATEVAYIITVTSGKDYNESKVMFVTLPGLDNTKVDQNDNTKIKEFYSCFNNITKENYQEILAKFNSLSKEEKARATAIGYFIDQVKVAFDGSTPILTFEQLNIGSDYRYQYVTIRNNNATSINMNQYSLRITNSNGEATTYKLNTKTINGNRNCLIFFGKNEEVDTEEVIYPDLAIDYRLDTSGKIEILDQESKVIDTVEYSSNLTRVGYMGDATKDYIMFDQLPVNSKKETFEVRAGVSTKIIDLEVMILQIPNVVTSEDGAKIDACYEIYNKLKTDEKVKVRNFTNLKNLKAQYDALGTN